MRSQDKQSEDFAMFNGGEPNIRMGFVSYKYQFVQ